MNETTILEVAREAIEVTLLLAAPIMIAGTIMGLIVALVQALTTVQEMTLTFVPKIIVIFVAVIALLPFMMTTLIEFTRSLFDRMVGLG